MRIGIVVGGGIADRNMIGWCERVAQDLTLRRVAEVLRTAYGRSVDIPRDSSWRLKR